MFEIVNDGEHTKIITNDLEIYIRGEFEIKRITPNADTSDVIKNINPYDLVTPIFREKVRQGSPICQ